MINEFSVLIADDNEINRWLLREQLEHWTMNITSAADGKQAWECLQAQRYSLVFLDVNMPFLNGFDLIRKLRSEAGINQQVATVAVTAHAQSEQRQKAMQAGFDDYLIKPIKLKQLQTILARWSSGTVTADYYAGQVLQKTGNNRELSQSLLNSLYAELPGHLADIEQALQVNELKSAWEIVHKLHGTFCFFNFTDCLAVIETLEQALLDENVASVESCFKILQTKVNDFNEHRTAVLERLFDVDL